LLPKTPKPRIIKDIRFFKMIRIAINYVIGILDWQISCSMTFPYFFVLNLFF